MAPAADIVEDPDVDMENEDDEGETQEKVINEEYKTWKKNSPFLYDMILSTALEWPTLTVQWMPDVKDQPDKNYTLHRLLLGTHTAPGHPNSLQIAEVEIPKAIAPNPSDYDEARQEIGGYGSKAVPSNPAAIKFNIVQKMDHPGEVNRARYQPQNPDIIATLTVNGTILIYDRTKHSITPSGTPKPDLELHGHTKEGFGLSWSPHEQGVLASGSEDTTVCLWDITTVTADSKKLKPKRVFTHHKSIVNDVQFHPHSKNFLGTVSDDLTLQIVDLRQTADNKSALTALNGHTDAINALAFNPQSEFLVATASADKTIGIWDLRNIKEKVHTLEGHVDAVTSVSWHPQAEGILASGSYDRRLIFWDLSRVGEEQLPDDLEDGVPELLFMHGGHTNHLADFSWNLHEPWLVASAAEDNVIQIWKVADAIVGRDDPEMALDELER